MKLAIPDLISNSYFPALAAAELGFFAAEGLDVSVELVNPVDCAYVALRDGEVDFVAGAAHAVPSAFPEWRGAKLLGALAQGMYWFLVMRAELGVARGDLAALRGRRNYHFTDERGATLFRARASPLASPGVEWAERINAEAMRRSRVRTTFLHSCFLPLRPFVPLRGPRLTSSF